MPSIDSKTVLDQVREALTSEPRVAPRARQIALDFADGALTLEGEVADIAAKKLALERAAAVPGVDTIVDRLHVTPAVRMGDGEIRDDVRNALLQEPAFAQFAISERVSGAVQVVREPVAQRRGWIEIDVTGGIVLLNGEVPGLDDKRLAGVLAWWVPGSRDVVNGIAVTPVEEDSDYAIAEAVRLVLEKDPFVNAGQIRVGVLRSVVTLTGLVPKEGERDMAEFDAWYVFGVDRVDNRIEVRA
ncbi:MAG: BON domain-containing protein [Pseudomonadota bacterium]